MSRSSNLGEGKPETSSKIGGLIPRFFKKKALSSSELGNFSLKAKRSTVSEPVLDWQSKNVPAKKIPSLEEKPKQQSIESIDTNSIPVPLTSDKFSSFLRKRISDAIKIQKRIVNFLTQLGILASLMLYIFLGGLIFQNLEGSHSRKWVSPDDLRQFYVDKLRRTTMAVTVLEKENWTRLAQHIFILYEKQYLKALESERIKSMRGYNWTYTESVFFSLTVITTVGYGNLTPQTSTGKLVTMFYALFGIPLTVLCITNVGMVMASVFRYVWKMLSCQRDVTTDNIHVPIVVTVLLLFLYIFGGSVMFYMWKSKMTPLESAYFCFITLSTIGFGDYVPGGQHGMTWSQTRFMWCAFYMLTGMAFLAMFFDLIKTEIKDAIKECANCFVCKTKAKNRGKKSRINQTVLIRREHTVEIN